MKALGAVSMLGYCAGVVALLVALDHYAFEVNETNHTGAPISWLLGLCVVGFVAGVALVKWRPANAIDVRVVWCVIVVSAIGIANIAIFDGLDIMMEYDRWIGKGMPDRPR